jgi:hypothetical protein
MVSGYEGAMVLAAETDQRSSHANVIAEAVMNSPDPISDRSGPYAAEHISPDDVPHIAVPFTEAANEGEFYSNPLWEVTLALACLATILVCLVAS